MAAADRLILLTGAAGFVGRQVLRTLAERGCKVRAVVRANADDDAAMATLATMAPAGAIESVVTTADLWAESADWCAKACGGVDTVIHAAWYAEPGLYLHSPKNADCEQGTLRLAQGAAAAGVRRFAGIGTCFEYDTSAGTLRVTTPLRPHTPYGAAKVATFRALSEFLPRRHVEFVWCRLFYLHGDGEDPRRLMPVLRSKLAAGEPVELGSGTQVRDYLDVVDAARLIVEAALGPVQGPVNICSGRAVTIRQLAERIADEYGRRDLLHFGARADNPADPPFIVGVRD
ncbi:MAG TPA: NAD(P)-dependent oxidoreductase [Rhizomicrobium sp.]